MKKSTYAALAISGLLLAGCFEKEADVASHNLSELADNFGVMRRVVFYNTHIGQNFLVIEGLCSLGNNDTQYRMSVTCKVGPNQYKKDFLGLATEVTFFSEQLDPAVVGVYHYKISWMPSALIPNIDMR